jgi:hypothetical protein
MLQITEPVSSKKCGRIIRYGYERAFCCQFFAQPPGYAQPQYFFFLQLKLFFYILKKEFALIFRIKYSISGSTLNEGLTTSTTFIPC